MRFKSYGGYNSAMKELITQIKSAAQNSSLLLVEDDEGLLQSLKKLLEHFFATIYTATNVTDAYECYKRSYESEQIVVITDINLGKESGVDLSRSIKALRSNQRIIAISALQESSIFISAIECGIERFLLKPIKKEKLFETLLTLLQMMEYDRKLQESQRALEASKAYAFGLLEEQDRFIKNAIHEIHTPLAVIITNIDLLRMQGIESPSLQAIEAGSRTIQNSYEDMTYLMKRDRAIAKKEPINLVAFVQERCDYFETIAAAHDIVLDLDEAGQTYLLFSPTKLARIVDNTLTNAIKYAAKPSKIRLFVMQTPEGIKFSVQNFGTVIEDTQKVFERFYRESTTMQGYGLGLHIVWQICQEEGVRIEVDSNAKDGTTFSYYFENIQEEHKE